MTSAASNNTFERGNLRQRDKLDGAEGASETDSSGPRGLIAVQLHELNKRSGASTPLRFLLRAPA
jgi:hypothetical protein